MKPGMLHPVAVNRASVLRWRRSPLLAVGRCCCYHRCCQLTLSGGQWVTKVPRRHGGYWATLDYAPALQLKGKSSISHLIWGMVARRENPGRCGWQGAWAAAASGPGLVRPRRVGDGRDGLPVTPAHLGMRIRQLAWRWGLDLRVAHCCLEHAGQYSGPGARRPGPPGSPLLSHQLKHRRKR